MNGDRRVVRIGSFIGLDRGVIGELFGFRQVIPPESGSGSGLSGSGYRTIVRKASGSGDPPPAIQPSCVNNCSVSSRTDITTCWDLSTGNNCSEQVKKKSRKTKTCSFYFLQLNKGLFKCLIIYYIVTVANPVK